MSNSYHTKNGRTSKRGAFINGVWHCNCEPRLPAEKFQTKNGGKNHGRWFFTCQKPQPKRCAFFLWSDDAKIREESAVIGNSRTEPHVSAEPKTPKQTVPLPQPSLPFSGPKSQTLSPESHRKRPWSPVGLPNDNEESFSWSSSGDEELASVVNAAVNDEKSPQKTARTLQFDTPGKRKNLPTTLPEKTADNWPHDGDIFTTPTNSTKLNGLLSPLDTNSRVPRHDGHLLRPSTNIVSEVLELLKPANLPPQIEHDLVDLLNRYHLRTEGIIRGRDITRIAVQTKDKKIAELQSNIAALEAEKETSRAVIAHLKQDIATSPKRPSRSRFGSKSEV